MPGMAIRNWLVRSMREPAGPCGILFPRHTPGVSKSPPFDALVWLRRDLRADDHAALYHALRAARQVWCAFVFDRAILDPLPRADRRVEFIRDSLVGVDAELRALAASHGVDGAGLIVRHGRAVDEMPALARALGVQAVYANHDDEPAPWRATPGARPLADAGIALHTVKDHVVFERSEVLTRRRRLQRVHALQERLAEEAATTSTCAPTRWRATPARWRRRPTASGGVPALADIGFEPTNLHTLRCPAARRARRNCWTTSWSASTATTRRATSRPSRARATCHAPALRHGVGPPLAREAHQRMPAGSRGAEVWLSELIWRDFYHQILHHHPRVVGTPSSPSTTASAGSTASTPTRCSPPGARAAPATRWSTPRCTRSTRPATCTTGCAWWWPAS
jgi:deoxyribodipyrimidine photo-lyase